jgi:hypothetical protein
MRSAIIVTLSLVLLCLVFLLVSTKSKKNSISNEGIIHFRSYYVKAADTFNYEKKISFFDTGTYYVKGNKTFRLPYHASPIMEEQKDSLGNPISLFLDLSNPAYLMDFDKKLVYLFNDSSAHFRVKSLDSLYSELLHDGRIRWNPQLVKIISIDTSSIISGVALKTDTKQTMVFRCSKQSWNITSPLNYFFYGLHDPVTSIAFGMKNNVDNKIETWLVYEITDVEYKKIDEKYFLIDDRNRSNKISN